MKGPPKSTPNPKGIVPSSPRLRGTSYLGSLCKPSLNRNAVVAMGFLRPAMTRPPTPEARNRCSLSTQGRPAKQVCAGSFFVLAKQADAAFRWFGRRREDRLQLRPDRSQAESCSRSGSSISARRLSFAALAASCSRICKNAGTTNTLMATACSLRRMLAAIKAPRSGKAQGGCAALRCLLAPDTNCDEFGMPAWLAEVGGELSFVTNAVRSAVPPLPALPDLVDVQNPCSSGLIRG